MSATILVHACRMKFESEHATYAMTSPIRVNCAAISCETHTTTDEKHLSAYSLKGILPCHRNGCNVSRTWQPRFSLQRQVGNYVACYHELSCLMRVQICRDLGCPIVEYLATIVTQCRPYCRETQLLYKLRDCGKSAH